MTMTVFCIFVRKSGLSECSIQRLRRLAGSISSRRSPYRLRETRMNKLDTTVDSGPLLAYMKVQVTCKSELTGDLGRSSSIDIGALTALRKAERCGISAIGPSSPK